MTTQKFLVRAAGALGIVALAWLLLWASGFGGPPPATSQPTTYFLEEDSLDPSVEPLLGE